ncbi:PREDICTED: protein NEN2-like [Camelina sativa]|uniref:Protein NEN2-like n=1 Tax=Camelina sativa TaxID=90675 RepID=A0ABM0VJS1_CAMSA|nr:PREDICTED: protein NEN2-like [Camelina sativa]
MVGLTPSEDRSEIAFFDLETTIPFRPGQPYAILEFGSILVCPKKLVELRNYSILVRPANLDFITPRSVKCNGIKREDVESAPSFADIADTVYDILHGRIWAGHNILKFDCPRIREAFAEIGRDPPVPKGTIDSLALLTQRFGRRAGDMKMATLAKYFGLGNQTHRSLDDVRMNLEVLKYCATVLFLESSLPDELIENSVTTTPETSSRRRRNIKTSPLQSHTDQQTGENSTTIPILSFVSSPEAQTDPFDMSTLKNEIAPEVLQSDVPIEENNQQSEAVASESEGTSDQEGFFELDKISLSSIRATHVPLYDGSQTMKLQLFLGDKPLQLHCPRLKVRFGINGKFQDKAGRRRLNFLVDLYPSLCSVLQECDSAAQTISVDSGSGSEWNPAVMPMKEFLNCPTARIHIPTEFNGDIDRYAAEIHQKEFSGATVIQKLISCNPKAEELESLLNRGTVLDAFFSLEPYDYQQRAGIRLVARKLVIYQ